jgi:predicted SAM-dependent methyltransferase
MLRQVLKKFILSVPEIRKIYDERNAYKNRLGQVLAGGLESAVPLATAPAATRSEARLHLGCGGIHLDGWCNVDVYPNPAVDVIDDIRLLTSFRDNSAREIYACHVLEHFGHEEIPPILRRWHEVLAPGGALRISVPDLDKIVQIYQKNWEHFQTEGNSPWIGLFYGGQLDPFDYHKTGFNFNWLRFLLRNAGFRQIEEYPSDVHFIPGVRDGSSLSEPFKENFSLCVLAVK